MCCILVYLLPQTSIAVSKLGWICCYISWHECLVPTLNPHDPSFSSGFCYQTKPLAPLLKLKPNPKHASMLVWRKFFNILPWFDVMYDTLGVLNWSCTMFIFMCVEGQPKFPQQRWNHKLAILCELAVCSWLLNLMDLHLSSIKIDKCILW